jgi:3-dehydroquinate dehydratase-2
MKKINIAVINGPNINLLGVREKMHYGNKTWDQIEAGLVKQFNTNEIQLRFYQSNHEGKIVDFIQEQGKNIDGIVINPAAFTKMGYSILEAILAFETPFIEVHLSNIFSRGGWHQDSIFSEKAIGIIAGFRENSYSLAIEGMIHYLKNISN